MDSYNDETTPARPHPLVTILSVLLTMFLTVALICAIPYFALTNTVDENSIRELADSISLTDLLNDSALLDELTEQVQNGDISMDDYNLSDYDLTDTSALAEKIYEHLDEDTLANSNITPDTISAVLESDNVNAFLQEKVDACVDAVYNEDAPSVTISKDEVLQLVKDNEDVIEEKTGVVLKDSDYEKLSDAMDKVSDSDQLLDLDLNNASMEQTFPVTLFRRLISQSLQNAFPLLCSVPIILLLLLNFLYIHKGIRDIGIASLIGGGLNTLLGLPIRHGLSTLTADNTMETLIYSLANRFMSTLLLYACVTLGTGVLCLVIHHFISIAHSQQPL